MRVDENRLSLGQHSTELNGIAFSYEIVGSGPPVIVQAPGWGIGSSYLVNGLAPLAEQFTLIFYDTRGNGRSSRPTDEKEMSTTFMVDDLEQLRRYWGLRSINLVGHSHGGFIALGYAIRYAEQVRKLVLIDAPISGGLDLVEMRKQIEARRGDARFGAAIAAFTGGGISAVQTDEDFATRLDQINPLYFYDPTANMPTFQKTVVGLPTAWANRTFRAAESEKPLSVVSELGQVRADTLVLVGNNDMFVPPSVAARIHAGIPQSEITIFDRSGHFPWIEARQTFFEAITQFIH